MRLLGFFSDLYCNAMCLQGFYYAAAQNNNVPRGKVFSINRIRVVQIPFSSYEQLGEASLKHLGCFHLYILSLSHVTKVYLIIEKVVVVSGAFCPAFIYKTTWTCLASRGCSSLCDQYVGIWHVEESRCCRECYHKTWKWTPFKESVSKSRRLKSFVSPLLLINLTKFTAINHVRWRQAFHMSDKLKIVVELVGDSKIWTSWSKNVVKVYIKINYI